MLIGAVTAAYLSAAAGALTVGERGLVIPLYRPGETAPLGVPETSDTVETGETLIFNVSDPTLELFRPPADMANGTAVIVAPGGGFVGLDYEAGGAAVARRLARRGVTAFVLKYRTIRSPATAMHMPEVHMREMETVIARARTGVPHEMPRFAGEANAVADGARAMAIVRSRAAEWGIDPRRVGMIGFSSGAYLAVDLAIGDKASRPDFVALIYGGLRTPVPPCAPPAFIAGAGDDEYQTNDPLLLFSAWRAAGAYAEVHVYERGGHGFGLTPRGMSSDHWFDELIWWLRSRRLMN
ncbi:MAG: hypothetical protein DI530_08365 [Sphingomonas sp.]|nr:MAG: hypothetical protein DI530_08365 [Sphingomonas sp.]